MQSSRLVPVTIAALLGTCGCVGEVRDNGAADASNGPFDGPVATTDAITDATAVTDAVSGAVDGNDLPVDAGEVPDEWAPLPPLEDGVWIRVRNRCAVPLWIHAAGSSGVLQPDDAEISTGQTRDYQAPREWSAARVTAYQDGPRSGEIEKAEVTLHAAGDSASLNYNITYVDWVGLPMKMAGAGGACGAEHEVGCVVPRSEVQTGCPAHLVDGDRCQSARSHCLNPANQGSAYCHALDAEIAECVAEVSGCAAYAGATTPEGYACSGLLASEPRLCAALNRGMLHDPDNSDQALYYVNEPYNTYAKWVHGVCPGIYAFSYDDWLAQGGFRSCQGSELRITFCPAG